MQNIYNKGEFTQFLKLLNCNYTTEEKSSLLHGIYLMQLIRFYLIKPQLVGSTQQHKMIWTTLHWQNIDI